jgi:hypothetical protein
MWPSLAESKFLITLSIRKSVSIDVKLPRENGVGTHTKNGLQGPDSVSPWRLRVPMASSPWCPPVSTARQTVDELRVARPIDHRPVRTSHAVAAFRSGSRSDCDQGSTRTSRMVALCPPMWGHTLAKVRKFLGECPQGVFIPKACSLQAAFFLLATTSPWLFAGAPCSVRVSRVSLF